MLKDGGDRLRHHVVDVAELVTELGHVSKGHALSGIQGSSITLCVS